jgi:hypothetical protein
MEFFELEPIFRFMLIGAVQLGVVLLILAVFILGVVIPLSRGHLYLALWDIGQPEGAEIRSLRRAFSLRQRYVVRYRYRVMQGDGTLKSFTRSEKVNRQVFAALKELYQHNLPVPIRYLAEKPQVAQLEVTMQYNAARLAARRAARPRGRRRRNSLQSYLVIAMFVILATLVGIYGNDINRFLDSLVP